MEKSQYFCLANVSNGQIAIPSPPKHPVAFNASLPCGLRKGIQMLAEDHPERDREDKHCDRPLAETPRLVARFDGYLERLRQRGDTARYDIPIAAYRKPMVKPLQIGCGH
ncbi:MAG: hypothetical protein JJ897_17910 [Marinibacterium sp.]|nr:hypothetical protein [Marinibacterium sp.]